MPQVLPGTPDRAEVDWGDTMACHLEHPFTFKLRLFDHISLTYGNACALEDDVQDLGKVTLAIAMGSAAAGVLQASVSGVQVEGQHLVYTAQLQLQLAGGLASARCAGASSALECASGLRPGAGGCTAQKSS